MRIMAKTNLTESVLNKVTESYSYEVPEGLEYVYSELRKRFGKDWKKIPTDELEGVVYNIVGIYNYNDSNSDEDFYLIHETVDPEEVWKYIKDHDLKTFLEDADYETLTNDVDKKRLYFDIGKRAAKEGLCNDTLDDRLSLVMDIESADIEYNLRLEDLLNADENDFVHDIIGIMKNAERYSFPASFNKDNFVPRFAGQLKESNISSDVIEVIDLHRLEETK